MLLSVSTLMTRGQMMLPRGASVSCPVRNTLPKIKKNQLYLSMSVSNIPTMKLGIKDTNRYQGGKITTTQIHFMKLSSTIFPTAHGLQNSSKKKTPLLLRPIYNTMARKRNNYNSNSNNINNNSLKKFFSALSELGIAIICLFGVFLLADIALYDKEIPSAVYYFLSLIIAVMLALTILIILCALWELGPSSLLFIVLFVILSKF